MGTTKVPEQISELLARRGVNEIFGNPGTTELPFLEGVHQRYYLTLHDSIAAGAADGLAQVTGSVAVANLHAAPGLGNSIAFIDTARRNRSPVLLTVGQQDLRHAEYEPLLHGNIESMVAGLVKYSHEIRSPSEVAPAIDLAFRHAMEPPRGPVLLSLPMDVMEAVGLPSEAPHTPPTPLAEPVDAIADRLTGASNPAIVAGYEVDVDDAFAELAELAKRLGAPVYAEPLCSRAPVSLPFANFAGDLLPASALIDSVLGDHDLVLLVGADLTLYPYTPAPLLPGKDLAYVGSDPSVARKLHAVHAWGDVKEQLRRLLPLVPASARTFRRPPDFGRANRVARAAPKLGGAFVLDAAARLFADHTIVDEAVSLTPTLKSMGVYHGHNSYFASRSGQLGWGLAASIGLGLRLPKVLVVIGDGALQYAIQSLSTLARYQIPVKVLVVNNQSYAILRSYSKAFHATLIDAEYLRMPGIDVDALAKGYGIPAQSVDTPNRLEGGLGWLRNEPGPALLNVAIDPTVPDLFA
ncbi:MAG: thiamine pyrophosphate-binding protein [Thermoplasmata archaeon]